MSKIIIGDITTTFKVGNVDCQIYLGDVKLYPTGSHDYSQDYFTFNVTTGGNIKWSGSTTANTLSYSKDNGQTWATADSATTISVNVGDKVLWKGTPTPQSNKGIGRFSGDTDVRFDVEGNAMSLLHGDNFVNQTSLEGKNYALAYLFSGNTNVTSAENLVLPATTLASHCYREMFRDCTNLTTAPSQLPATTLMPNCYKDMFSYCTNLTTAPSQLPATTLADSCYRSMFYNCTSLTTAPELPATTLANNCYYYMFQGCTSLTTAPELPATTMATSAYTYMFQGCTSLTTAPELPATTLANNCYTNMFAGCTSLTTAPELPATTLASNCYYGMFNGCASLTTAPSVLPATTLASSCYSQMFRGCTNLTTAPELPATTLASYCYQYMFSGCSSLNYIKCLATDISANGCTSNWVSNVASSGTFVKDASMTDWTIGVNGIPSGWTVQDYKDYSRDYFTIVSESDDNTISILKHGSAPAITVSASTDNGQTWTEFTGGTIATLNTGSKLLLKGVNNRWAYEDSDYNSFISTSAYHVEGNIMSLLFGDNFKGQTSLSGKGYALAFLFLGNTNITSAENLVLPATTLADWCYYNMFNGCSSLTTAPELPATTLTYECYDGMFYRCTSLTTAPELSATTLASYCYYYMFYGCTSLNYIKCLATDISANYCTSSWVNGVAASGTFVKDASMTSWTTGNNGIPSGWTVEDDGRDYSLDHFTIVSEADNNTISILKNGSAPAITVSASTDDGQTWTTYSTSGTIATLNTGDKLLLKGVNNKWGAALVSNYNKITASASFHVEGNIMSLLYGDNFVDQTSISGRNYVFQCLFEGVTTLTNAKNLILPATTLAGDCYGYMFNACTSLTTAPSVLPATTLVDSCYRGMLQGCSSLTKAPELPAPTLATLCYAWLFNGCSSLNYIKCLATNKSASRCTDSWVNDVSATGTFVKDPNMSSWTTGINGIPSGWTVQDA